MEENWQTFAEKVDLSDLEKRLAEYSTLLDVYGNFVKPKTEEEELQEFIEKYIDEPVPQTYGNTGDWASRMYSAMTARSHSKSLAYPQMYGRKATITIMDDFCEPVGNPHPPTFKPTKKQAKLLRKFRKLKRFK